ncbi:MAG: hypothetical protein SFW36_16175 [Leptolyngbyaceae cyanobacterium bins.59]|nr:hypothetical protein [Leptolyngbyaceae cyanobacterium bins.59]
MFKLVSKPASKLVISFLFGLLLFVTGCSRVEKPISQTQTYTWSVSSVDGTSSSFVCKQIEIAIYRRRSRQPDVNSVVVDDRYCANVAKPVVLNQG